MKTGIQAARLRTAGFTVVELLIALTIFVLVVAGTLSIWILHRNTWYTATLIANTSGRASTGLEYMVYGVGTNSGLRAASRGGVSNTVSASGWRISYGGTRFIQYNRASSNIVDETGFVLCTGVVTSSVEVAAGGCRLDVTTRETGGRRTATSRMLTYVRFRN